MFILALMKFSQLVFYGLSNSTGKIILLLKTIVNQRKVVLNINYIIKFYQVLGRGVC